MKIKVLGTGRNEEYLMAAMIVAREEGTTVSYALKNGKASLTRKIRRIYRAKAENMDEIRENWLAQC